MLKNVEAPAWVSFADILLLKAIHVESDRVRLRGLNTMT